MFAVSDGGASINLPRQAGVGGILRHMVDVDGLGDNSSRDWR
jgi:hypothetical protein